MQPHSAYVRSWSSDRDDAEELGAEQLDCWAEAVRRAMDFRKRVGDDRFVDVSFADLQTDPIGTLDEQLQATRACVHRRGAGAGCGVGRRTPARPPRCTHLRTG